MQRYEKQSKKPKDFQKNKKGATFGRKSHLCKSLAMRLCRYTMPWLIMALATFMKPATLAPFT